MSRSVDRSTHFSRSELQCKCGCGLCYMRKQLLDGLEHLRTLCCEHLGKDVPIHLGSAFRCTRHNESIVNPKTKKRLSSPFSQHLVGTAGDPHTPEGLTVELFAEFAEQVPQFYTGGIGIYPWGLHVDVRGYKARWSG